MDKQYKKIKNWYNENTEFYSKNSGLLLNKQLKKFISFLPQNGKILDIGSGPGHDTEYFAIRNFQTIGIDFSSGMINYAIKNRSAGSFLELDTLKLNSVFSKNEFDGIWISSVFTHLKNEDITKVLKQIFVVSKSNAIVAVIVRRRFKRKINDNQVISRQFYKKDINSLLNAAKMRVIFVDDFLFSEKAWIFIIVRVKK